MDPVRLAQCPAQIKCSTDARYHYDEDHDDGHDASMLGTIPGTGRKGLLIPQKIYGTWHSPSSIQVPTRQNWPSFILTRLSRQDRVYSGSRPTTGLEKKGYGGPSKAQMAGTVKYFLKTLLILGSFKKKQKHRIYKDT